uniref:Uncharacterized protein n=1 Tax=Thermogemmatispora argillosa TaxID=2045280 RepID=A0A455T0D2_9CHLR|nr:hypothetical protein KTA_15890 [Thermogemmatispora argillosa]
MYLSWPLCPHPPETSVSTPLLSLSSRCTYPAADPSPLRAFRQQVAPLNDTHITCVQNCAKALAALLEGTSSNGLPLMQGAGADALADTFSQFLDSAQQLTGSTPGELLRRLFLASQTSERRANDLENDLSHTLQYAPPAVLAAPDVDASVPLTASTDGAAAAAEGLSLETIAASADGAAATLSAGAVLQGGLDIPWDAVTVAVGLVALGFTAAVAFSTAPQVTAAREVETLEEIEANNREAYSSDMQTGPDQEPLPPEPPSPTGPQSPFGKWVLLVTALGVTAGLGLSGDTTPSDLAQIFPMISCRNHVASLAQRNEPW